MGPLTSITVTTITVKIDDYTSIFFKSSTNAAKVVICNMLFCNTEHCNQLQSAMANQKHLNATSSKCQSFV